MAKIVSWNINGVRSLPQSLSETIRSLDADICCFQETKVTRGALDTSIAFVDGYNSVFGFSRKREGYSGVATYCRDSCSPTDGQEGLTSILNSGQSAIDSSDSSKLSDPSFLYNGIFTVDELKSLDGEGRAVITRHKLRIDRTCGFDQTTEVNKCNGLEESIDQFNCNGQPPKSSSIDNHDQHQSSAAGVDSSSNQIDSNSTKYLNIINVYCPRLDPEKADRKEFKQNFYRILQLRAEHLLKSGDHVLIVGDINCSHKRIDHCDPDADPDFDDNESRKWMDRFLYSQSGGDQILNSSFIDLFRNFYPDTMDAFTCWCNYKNARVINFGSRIDYAIADYGLIRSGLIVDVKHLTNVYGSDHCPVQVTLKNCQLIKSDSLPRACTKFMPEFKGQQQLMHQFLVKRTSVILEMEEVSVAKKAKKMPEKMKRTLVDFYQKAKIEEVRIDEDLEDRKMPSILKEIRSGSATISNHDHPGINFQSSNSSSQGSSTTSSQDSAVSDASSSSTCKSSTDIGNGSKNETVAQWNQIFKAKSENPLCTGHQEPSVLRVSKKSGPNFNRRFYSCGRPIGKKGDPNASCNFFRWTK